MSWRPSYQWGVGESGGGGGGIENELGVMSWRPSWVRVMVSGWVGVIVSGWMRGGVLRAVVRY